MYFSNLFLRIFFTKSLKKKSPIEYKIKAPIDIEIAETNVPNNCPNNIPEKIKIGDPNPKSETQVIAKIKKYNEFIILFELM